MNIPPSIPARKIVSESADFVLVKDEPVAPESQWVASHAMVGVGHLDRDRPHPHSEALYK